MPAYHEMTYDMLCNLREDCHRRMKRERNPLEEDLKELADIERAIFVLDWVNANPNWFVACETMSPTAMLVWAWDDCPEVFKALSQNGGDEDWVLVIPSTVTTTWIGWADSGSSFGVCDVAEYTLPNGYRVRIGCHA